MSHTRSKIHLHIEELSLPGYTPAERREFIAELKRELAGGIVGNPSQPSPGAHDTLHVTSSHHISETPAQSTVRGLLSKNRKETVK